MSEVTLYHGDCLEVMPTLDGPVDMILADLPYGTTACKWDTVIPFEPLWEQYKRLIKRNGAIVLFGSQPFTSALVMSNPAMFRYEWVWDKVNMFTNHTNAKRMPMRAHESICVFYQEQCIYCPQKYQGRAYGKVGNSYSQAGGVQGLSHSNLTGELYPHTLIRIPGRSGEQGLHPTQKPVALMEYLIRTYTNEGEVVLDNTMGSGTTGVACVNTGRDFIGIEKDAGYFEIAERRIQEAQNKARQMEFVA